MEGRGLLRMVTALVLATGVSVAVADASLEVTMSSSLIDNRAPLGAIQVDGIGEVTLIANRDGNRLVVFARDAAGQVVGKAETVVGMTRTPIYVMTSSGLSKIIIFWGKN